MSPLPFTVLLVDDNEFVLRPLTRFLEEEGYRVVQARDGEEALDRIAEDPIDLVLLDVMMPGLSGLEVLERLRWIHDDDELPVIMATASSGSDQVVKAFELGANDYVTKPLDFPVVGARLQTRLRKMTPRAARLQDRTEPAQTVESPLTGIGSVLDGKYRLESRIGEGSFAEVYQATHLKLERQVAVKLLKTGSEDEEELQARFLREGRSTCRIDHPNAVSVLDASVTANGEPFLVTELLHGHTLEAELKRDGSLSPSRCAEVLLPVCDVLAEAHALGIVHRDIKPQNIFLHRTRRGEVVKVLDFGIAKLIGDSVARRRMTSAGAGPGTPAYMAPERFSDREIDGSADVYSLGIMLYKMLAGRLPFAVADGNLIRLALMHQTEKPAALCELRPRLSKEVEEVVFAARGKEPGKRPGARELAASFGAALGFEVLPGAARRLAGPAADAEYSEGRNGTRG